MHIKDSDMRAPRPVRRYLLPKYPTREQARLNGKYCFSLPARAALKLGRIIMASSLLIPTIGAEPLYRHDDSGGPPGCGGGCPDMGHTTSTENVTVAKRYLSEDTARLIVISRFSAEGVTFSEDVPYSAAGVEFNADGFDNATGIGFEYDSEQDLDLSRDLYFTNPGDWDKIFLKRTEEQILEDNMKTGGDCVRPFESGLGEDEASERALLERQVDAFIAWLKAGGRI